MNDILQQKLGFTKAFLSANDFGAYKLDSFDTRVMMLLLVLLIVLLRVLLLVLTLSLVCSRAIRLLRTAW